MATLDPEKTYALLHKGRIHNIFNGAELPEYNENDLHIIEAPEGFRVGDFYPPQPEVPEEEPDFETKRRAHLSKMQSKRAMAIAAGAVEFKGYVLSTNAEMIRVTTIAMSLYAVSGKLPKGFFLPDIEGEKVYMNEEEAREFAGLLFERAFHNYERHFDWKKKVLSATTEDEFKNETEWL